MKRLFFWILLLVALAGAASALRIILSLRAPIPAAKLNAAPPSSPYKDKIGARGLVESVDENVRIAPAVPGLVDKVSVVVDQDVKEGDVLIVQDSRDAQAAVAAAETELAALESQLKESEVMFDDKRDMWERTEKLIAQKVVSDDERQRTRFAMQAAQARVANVRARIASGAASLQRAKVQRDLLTVRAPRSGRILQVNIRPGEFASPTDPEPMIILGDVEHFQLRADVDESDASRVRPNTSATAYIKGRSDIQIPLRFVRIEPFIIPKKSLTGESSERVDTRVLQIIYSFDQPEAKPGEKIGIYVGQQMDVFIERRNDAAE